MLKEEARGKLVNILKAKIDEYFSARLGHIESAHSKPDMVGINSVRKLPPGNKLSVPGEIRGKKVEIIIDTGADVSGVSEEFTENIDEGEAKFLRNADGSKLNVLGSAMVQIELENGKKMEENVQVFKQIPGKVILGMPSINKFGLKNILPKERLDQLVEGEESSTENWQRDWNKEKFEIYKGKLQDEDYISVINRIETCNLEASVEESFSIFQCKNDASVSAELNEVRNAEFSRSQCIDRENADTDTEDIGRARSDAVSNGEEKINNGASAAHTEKETIDINKNLPPEKFLELRALLDEFKDLFLFDEMNFRAGQVEMEPIEYSFLDPDPIYVKP